MGLLRTRERTPAEEAAKQIEIANAIERERQDAAARNKALTQQNAMNRRALWAEQAQQVEDKRMEAFAREQQKQRDKEARERETQTQIDAEKIRVYREAKAHVDELDRQIAQLNRPDLTALEAAEKLGLKEIREQADSRLVTAERAVGRHRNGGW